MLTEKELCVDVENTLCWQCHSVKYFLNILNVYVEIFYIEMSMIDHMK